MKNSSDQMELVNIEHSTDQQNQSKTAKNPTSEHQPLLNVDEHSTSSSHTAKQGQHTRFTITPVTTNSTSTNSSTLNANTNASLLSIPQPPADTEDYSDLLLKYVRENRANKLRELFELTRLGEQSNADAAAKAYFEKIKLDVDIHDEMRQTPLLVATRMDFHEVAMLLIEHNANVNKCDADNWTPLMNAAKNGNVALCRALLEKKALVEARDTGQFTPLMWACYKNRADTVRLLLDSNANPNAQCKNTICCLTWAAGRGHAKVVDELLTCKQIKVNLQARISSFFISSFYWDMVAINFSIKT